MKKIVFSVLFLILLSGSFSAYFSPAKHCDFYIGRQCFSCDDPRSFDISSENVCHTLCPHRVVTYKTCSLAVCPQSHPYRDKETGSCRKEKMPIYLADEQIKVMNETEKKYTSTDDGKGNCPSDKPLADNGLCYPCNYPYDVNVSSDMLGLCPNRTAIPYPWAADENHIPTYLPCPQDKPLRSWTGECFSCDYPENVRILTQCLYDEKICGYCPNRTVLPQEGGNRPSILNCPENFPLMDTAGICFSCDTEIAVDVARMEENCTKHCQSQRHLEGSLCLKNGT